MDNLPLLLIPLAIVAILVFYKFVVLPEFEQVIVYRLGRFHKLGGPGLVRYSRWLDTLERRIDTRAKKQSISLTGLFVYDIPFGFKLDIWMRFAPREIAGRNHEFLTQLAHITENEQMSNVRTEVKRAVQQSLAQIQNRYPLPANPVIIDKLLPIIPGSKICNELLDLLRERLMEYLPQVGFVLSGNHEFTIFDITLGQDIIDIFNRGRLAKSLRDDIPTINDEMVFEFLGKVRGLDINVKHVIVDTPSDDMDVRIRDEDRDIEIRPSRTRRKSSSAPIGPPPWQNSTADSAKQTEQPAAQDGNPSAAKQKATASQTTSSNSNTSNQQTHEPGEGIPINMPVTDEDWRVMKTVPRNATRA